MFNHKTLKTPSQGQPNTTTMVDGFEDDKSINLSDEDTGRNSEPTLYEEKALEKIPAAHNKQSRMKNHKTRQTLLRLELQRRRMEKSPGVTKFSSLGEVSRSIATSVIRVKPLKQEHPSEKISDEGNNIITSEPKAGQRYFGLAKHLQDAALIGPRNMYKKNTQDPPEAVLPSGLQFGTPLIINRSQLSNIEDLNSSAEYDATLDRGETLRHGASSNASVNSLKEEIWVDEDTMSEHARNETFRRLSSRQWMQICAVGVVLAFTVVFTVIFAQDNFDYSSGEEIANILSSPLDGRHAPTRPSPALPPAFDKNSIKYVAQPVDALDNDALTSIFQEFSNEDLLENQETPQGKALRWIHSSKLDGIDIFRIKQRYVLAVFYYYFEAESWSIEYGWLSNNHECTWYGVGCGSDKTGDFSSAEPERQDLSIDENLVEIVTCLDLSENNLHGKIPEELKFLTNLTQLILSKNYIQGSIPKGILSNFRVMHTLYLDQNYITGQVPDELTNLLFLRNLDLHDNSFRGTIPSTIQFANDLVDVRLQNNQFYGIIPDAFHSTTNLRVFLAGSNEIEGEIPASLANSPSLVALHLHENQLHGNIPEFISTELRQLHLDGNGFEGPMPLAIAPSFSTLEELLLENNVLTGEIPSTLGDQTNLRILELQGNRFTGSVPNSVCVLKTEHRLTYFKIACPVSVQEVKCDCCDSC